MILLSVGAYMAMAYVRGRRATHFGNLRTLERVHGFKRFYVSPWILGFKVIIVSLLFLTATQVVELRRVAPIVDTDYVLLIDSSASMASTDFEPNRLAAAKQISASWLGILPNSTRVGMVSFAQRVNSFVAPTTDKGLVMAAVEQTAIDYNQSGTALDLSLNHAIDLFESNNDKRAILLFTDGTDDVEIVTLARAKENGIRIFAFGIGSNESADLSRIPEDFRDLYSSLELDFSTLQNIADETGGTAYRISSEEELDDAFDDVTLEDVAVKLNTTYYIVVVISLLSILELLIYSRLGAL